MSTSLFFAYVLWFLEPTISPSWTVDCPPSCSCADSSVICSCEDALGGVHGKEFRLAQFRGIHFIDSLVIHSCDKVIIPQDAFNGTIIQHGIKIIRVKDLKLSSWVFRGLRKAPAQLTMQAVSMHYCPANAFSGLKHMKHIWFRNTTIGTLAAGAFSDVADVDYIYFRDSVIKVIEDGAFGSMRSIRHFFFRGNITVHSAASTIFYNSTVNEIIFEEALFAAPSNCFLGLQAASVQLVKSNWKNAQDSGRPRNFSRKIDHFSISSSTLDQLAMDVFYYTAVLRITHSTIHYFAASENIQFPPTIADPEEGGKIGGKIEWGAEVRLQNIEFEETAIQTVQKDAFKNTGKIEKLKISRSQIAVIQAHAFRNARINQLHIHQTHIDRLAPEAFANFSIISFFWSECDIGSIGGKLLAGTDIGVLTFLRCRIALVGENGFSGMKAGCLVFEKTKIYKCEESIFFGSKIRNLSVIGTEIVSGTFASAFRNLRATFFLCINNLFDCDLIQCDVNALILGPQSSPDLPWQFQANHCSKWRICRHPPELTFEGAICKSYHFLVQCICTNSKYARVPDINASVLIIGDCGALEIDLNRNEQLSSLHIFRTEALKIVKMPQNIKILEVFHSKIVSIRPRAFLGLEMERIKIVSAKFEFIPNHSFVNFQLSSIILLASTLSYVESRAFSNTTISELHAEKSNFFYVSNFWQHFANITLVQVFVNLPRFLLDSSGILCMKEVIVACECLVQDLRGRNSCSKLSPICSSRRHSINCQEVEEGEAGDEVALYNRTPALRISAAFILLLFKSQIYV